MNTKPKPTIDAEVESAPFLSDASLKAIFAALDPGTQQAIAPKGELAKLAACQMRYEKGHELRLKLSYDAVKAVYKQQHGEFTEHLRKVNHEKLEKAEGWSFDDYLEEAAQKRPAVNAEIRRQSAEAWPTAEGIRKRFAEACRDFALDLQATEEAVASRFSVPYRRSATVLALLKAAMIITDPRWNPYVNGMDTPPKVMVPFLPPL